MKKQKRTNKRLAYLLTHKPRDLHFGSIKNIYLLGEIFEDYTYGRFEDAMRKIIQYAQSFEYFESEFFVDLIIYLKKRYKNKKTIHFIYTQFINLFFEYEKRERVKIISKSLV